MLGGFVDSCSVLGVKNVIIYHTTAGIRIFALKFIHTFICICRQGKGMRASMNLFSCGEIKSYRLLQVIPIVISYIQNPEWYSWLSVLGD